ncbi:hypothetical protein [Herpetosiphon geysericola]|uniref:Uncharacterized protein n=1 Tax=Herpetosiphon geysericola TaxID=70996 RepID=A0A0P6Y4W1_9CHLR|nr:hypothetical protein [Herpetosiphon geysericola]KPL80212.1 hypothetical protein SE18_24455 [Herpetosiphon geysericola]
MATIFDVALASIDQPPEPPPELSSGELPASPSGRRGRRKLESHQRITVTQTTVSSHTAQALFWNKAIDYLGLEKPAHFILGRMPPGTGKTYLGVKLALYAANELGWRVAYIGPRHNFFDDVMNEVAKQGGDPDQWFHWLPRQRGDDNGKEETCRHEPHMATWLHRGYEAMDFCQKVCGWDYIKDGCPYYEQQREAKATPILYIQHQHLTAGHPLLKHCKLIIGDESPLGAFPDNWVIPQRWIMPDGMPYDEPLTELLLKMQGLASQSETSRKPILGKELLDKLGGAESVAQACAMLDLPEVYEKLLPRIWYPSDAEDAPFWHLPDLVQLLERECEAAQTGKSYVSRVRLVNGKLHLLKRNVINDHAPPHIIWFDATANAHLYHTVFQRPVEVVEPAIELKGKVYQVYESLNNRSKLIKAGEIDKAKVTQLREQLHAIIAKHNYHNPVIITHLPLVDSFRDLGMVGHFGGERGTNKYEGCDVAFIIGAQQPSVDDIAITATMIYHERMTPFNTEWQEKDLPFVNHPHSYLVSGFYADADLQALLWQGREAEVIQAAHRVRPVRHAVDVWLLTNIPIAELPPDELVNVRDLFDAPDGVDVYQWRDFMDIASVAYESGEPLTSKDIMTLLDCAERTAQKYITLLRELHPDQWEQALVPNNTGRAGRALRGIKARSPL